MKEDILKLKDKNGKIHEYKIILAFECLETGKHYIVYTDMNSENKEEIEVYAKIIDPKDLTKLENIKTEREWKIIKAKLKEIGEVYD